MPQKSNDSIYTIGTDPELFLAKGDRYVSAIPYTNGTKEDPEVLPSGGIVSHDNVALEFGVTPAVTYEEFVWNIGSTLSDLYKYLPVDVDMVIVPSARFPRKELKDKKAQAFGCDPDFCAWTGNRNVAPRKAKKETLRTCGGHIHVGFVKGTNKYAFLLDHDGQERMIFAMDLLHGMLSTTLDYSAEAIERRRLYGKAGCFRRTDYGVEYRTLSNYWIKSPKLVRLMHYLTDAALELATNRGQIDSLCTKLGGPQLVQKTISTGDAERATICAEHMILPMLDSDTVALYRECQIEVDDYDLHTEWGIK